MAIAALVLTGNLNAQSPVAATAPPAEAVPGWSAFLDGLRDLPDRILARVPAERRDDPQLRAEAGRLALSAATAAGLDALASDPDRPVFIPQLNNYLTIGQPNADTNYRAARITPGGTYRMRGRRGSMAIVRVAQSGPPPKQSGAQLDLGPPRHVFDLKALPVDANGNYDVILSPTRPAGYSGDWWQLDPSSNMLLVRMVGSDWGKEIEPTLSIERVDAPASRPRPPAQVLEGRLRAAPAFAGNIGPLVVNRVALLRSEGYLNKLKAVDFSHHGGLAGQFYYEGAYELADDEALILEAKLPERCLYRSIILTNDLYETTDWYNNHSSLNNSQAKADRDGVLRVVVSARDPGVLNWLDTAGYPSGVIQGRWTECTSQPVPTMRKVALADVRSQLPPETSTVTPQEREQQIRDRRSALQQRPLW